MDGPEKWRVVSVVYTQFLIGQEVSAEQAPVFIGYCGGLYEFDRIALLLNPFNEHRIKVVTMNAGIAEELHHLDFVRPNSSWILDQQVVFSFDIFT